MAATATSASITAVQQWYEKFDKGDIDGVVDAFTDDAILLVGAGESDDYVPYGGRFVGKAQIRHYYTARFAKTMQIIRPLCGLKPFIQETGRWVVVSGTIKDTHSGGRTLYEGRYLHVWSVNPDDYKFASMSMFFESRHTAL